MFDNLTAFQVQETVHGWVVTVSRGDYTNAWTARDIGEAATSLVNEYLKPKPQPLTKGDYQ